MASRLLSFLPSFSFRVSASLREAYSFCGFGIIHHISGLRLTKETAHAPAGLSGASAHPLVLRVLVDAIPGRAVRVPVRRYRTRASCANSGATSVACRRSP
jgi:hypothetical protein